MKTALTIPNIDPPSYRKFAPEIFMGILLIAGLFAPSKFDAQFNDKRIYYAWSILTVLLTTYILKRVKPKLREFNEARFKYRVDSGEVLIEGMLRVAFNYKAKDGVTYSLLPDGHHSKHFCYSKKLQRIVKKKESNRQQP